jgi:hypothetical protein
LLYAHRHEILSRLSLYEEKEGRDKMEITCDGKGKGEKGVDAR